MIKKIFSVTPKKLRNISVSLALVSLLFPLGLAGYLSFYKHIVISLNNYLFMCLPVVVAGIAEFIWLGLYELPETDTTLQSRISFSSATTAPVLPSTDKPGASQHNMPATQEGEKIPREGSSGRSDGPRPTTNRRSSSPQPASNTQFIKPPFPLPPDNTQTTGPIYPVAPNNNEAADLTYPAPADSTQTIESAASLPVYGSLDTITLAPETIQFTRETQLIENSPTQQLHIPDIPTLLPISQSIPTLNVHEFIYPKEGKKPENSQDKFAYSYQGNRCRFAVADGVGSSFLPNEWAQILTNNFVTRDEDFKDSEDFVPWLIACSRQWYKWVDEQWIPLVQQRLGRYVDWSRDRARGAQATFIGCSFDATPLTQHYPMQVNVMTIGDSVLFHLQPPRPSQEQWRYTSYPSIKPEEFGPIPFTLATRSDLIEQAWQTAQIKNFTVEWGDIVLLTTDALAKWILTYPQRIPTLLAMSDIEAFGDFVLHERNEGTLELDDVTLLIIYLQ
jgi:Protein phosphatase 2C